MMPPAAKQNAPAEGSRWTLGQGIIQYLGAVDWSGWDATRPVHASCNGQGKESVRLLQILIPAPPLRPGNGLQRPGLPLVRILLHLLLAAPSGPLAAGSMLTSLNYVG
jgi:hypothetical protein